MISRQEIKTRLEQLYKQRTEARENVKFDPSLENKLELERIETSCITLSWVLHGT